MPGAVDWALAERVAVRIAGREPFAASYHAASLEPDLLELTAQAEQRVAEFSGLVAPTPARARVVDRAGWIRANLASFERLLRPVVTKLEDRLGNRNGAPQLLTAKVAGLELGTLLGALSQRVLGQYDLLVVEDDTAADQDIVYYVGPNLLSLEKRFGFPPREFRLWIALHETTHRAQFTGVPWLRPYFLDLVSRLVGDIEPDPGRLLDAVKSLFGAEGRAAMDDGGLLALIATPEQRELLAKAGGLMSLLEGHGDVTMDRAASSAVPSADRFARVLRERRRNAPTAMRIVQKLMGLEAKLNQYEQGERFLHAIEAAAGPRAVDRCWEGPEHLPTLEEIRAPERWLAREGLVAAA
jgi:coenzyme F420 biosynthesis associated uncharacterized protein